MKSKDLLVIGGVGLALYLLTTKSTPNDEAGSQTQFIPVGSPLDIGGLLTGLSSMFSGIPSGVTNINIPEIKGSEFDIMQWATEAEQWIKNNLPPGDRSDGSNGSNGSDGGYRNPIEKAIDTIKDDLINLVPTPFRGLVTKPDVGNWLEDWREIRAESEAIFEEAGFEEVTPQNIDVFTAAREKVIGRKAEEIPPLYTQLTGKNISTAALAATGGWTPPRPLSPGVQDFFAKTGRTIKGLI